ncbi:MAG: DUF456 family protein [Firmicutes bacterium]|nr:DUF456 family protein [Bacillota bacterium]
MAAIGMFLAIILFILGLAGTVLPVLPGAPLIWLGILIYGLFTGFAKLSLLFYLGQGLAVLLTVLVDYAGTAYGARRYGGSRAAIWGSAAGISVAPIFMGVPGFIIGPFLGAFIAEALAGRPINPAFRAAFGTLIGLVGSTILKLGIEIGMIVWFYWTVLR